MTLALNQAQITIIMTIKVKNLARFILQAPLLYNSSVQSAQNLSVWRVEYFIGIF